MQLIIMAPTITIQAIFRNSYNIKEFSIIGRMAASSTRVQMMNLRDRRSNYEQRGLSPGQDFETNSLPYQQINQLRFSLPQEQAVLYEPTASTGVTFQTRTATRLLKGKFGGGSSQDQKFQSTAASQHPGAFEQERFDRNKAQSSKGSKVQDSNGLGTSATGHFAPKNPALQSSNEGLRLVLPDEYDYLKQKQKKLTSLLKPSEPKEQPSNKRILVERKQDSKPPAQQTKQPQKNAQPPSRQPQRKQPKPNVQQVPITQLKPEHKQLQDQDTIENDNQLVGCPEGCGRKFNKKALQSHVKACKLVFMSKRKQFNSQAKRITSKEQAAIVKQSKQKEKKEAQTKIQKSGEAWKTQSQGFRAVLKALKQEDLAQEGEEEKEVKVVTCQYCEKKFSQILISKHIPICEVRRQREKKLGKKASKK